MLDLRTQWMTAPALLALGLIAAGPAAAQDTRVVPANTVVHVKLDDRLSTKSSQRGERFSARLVEGDYSGFPEGTRFEGRVTEVKPARSDRPGILNVHIDRAILPGGVEVAVDGMLASLEDKDVRRTSDGRMESRHGGKGKFETKWVGYGAGAGAVLATVFGGSFLKGALLGALGGAAYSYVNKDKNKDSGDKEYHDVTLDPGTDFGIRLNQRASFKDSSQYRYPEP